MKLNKNNSEIIVTWEEWVLLANFNGDAPSQPEDELYLDWYYLISLVEKIERITINEVDQYNDTSHDLNFSVEIRNNGCRIYRSWTTSVKPDFKWHQTGSKINSVYNAVVEFIKWYNQNK